MIGGLTFCLSSRASSTTNFCLLLVEAFKSDWKERLMPPGWGRVSERAMRGAYDELLLRADATEETRQLARQLNARAYNF